MALIEQRRLGKQLYGCITAVHTAQQQQLCSLAARRSALAARPIGLSPSIQERAQQAQLALLNGPDQRAVWRGSRLQRQTEGGWLGVRASATGSMVATAGCPPPSNPTWMASLPRSAGVSVC